MAAIRRGARFLALQQGPDGSWRGDYSGPMFLLPMYVATAYACGREIPRPTRDGMITSLLGAPHEDGGVGLHAEAREGTMFTTVLTYVALRLLGLPPGHDRLTLMRRWIQDRGTALGAASWGKWLLAFLNLYDYRGLHAVLPELYLLPAAVPFHPGRFWCHARQVYLPMAYLYATRARIPEDELIKALRTEIYDRPWDAIPFAAHRDTLAVEDRLAPVPWLGRLARRLADWYERHRVGAWRRRALATIVEHLEAEDRATNYIRIGPVNAVLNTLVHHFRDAEGAAVRESWRRLPEYLWHGPDGVKMNGYNSSALWDTAMAVQALEAAAVADENPGTLQRAWDYIRANQVLDDAPDHRRYFRHASRGGWPFSDRAHGWPISDCTAEGLKCAFTLAGRVDDPLEDARLRESVDLILSLQNRDGGWPTYERQRAGRWAEALNPSDVFRDIMVDYSSVECTSACLQALSRARGRFAGESDHAIDRAIVRGARFIRRRQRQDGSWEGSWGVCFTYGTWFAVWGLRAASARPDDPAIRRACRFLLARQNPDGGWGEDYQSCLQRRWVPRASHVVNTAWALMTLTAGSAADTAAARHAARFLVRRQQGNGDWPPDSMVGVFNRTTLINYENYRRYFPVWALACVLAAAPPAGDAGRPTEMA